MARHGVGVKPLRIYKETLMAPKPKKQDYQASEAEKTSASVAKAQHDFFKNTLN